jgi:hypothetical protein
MQLKKQGFFLALVFSDLILAKKKKRGLAYLIEAV